jgi:hypothetical protein
LALKLYEYEEIRDAEEHITHFLLIEEPELIYIIISENFI